MTLSSERFREQLLGYLYGELEGESLREFEDSLRASEQYRSELSSMQETLRVSRQGLAALRERELAPPSRVSRAVLAAAAAEAAAASRAQAEEPLASRVRREDVRDGEPEASSFWSFLRTPWFLPTLGVAAAVSVVVLHKQVETPKMPEYQVPSAEHAAPAAPESAPARTALDETPPPAEPADAPSAVATTGGGAAEGVGRASDAVESKRAQTRARPRERADEARAAPRKAATDDTPATKGYAVPPPAWSGLAREGSAKKELGEGRGPGSPSAADKAEEYEAPPVRDLGGSEGAAPRGSRGGGGGVAAKPAARTRSAAPQAAPAAPSAPAASAPLDDEAPASSGARAEPARAPDEAVKEALEHMEARRFGQAAVAYRELLQRYPKDSRVPFFRSQLTAALAALSHVDAIR